MFDLIGTLRQKGLGLFECPFDANLLAGWNAKLDPLFAARRDQGLRSYVTATELIELGLASDFFNSPMRSLIRSVMPDAVLATFDCYETKERANGAFDPNTEWHRDIETLPGLRDEDLNFCSIFIYLSDVGPASGPFEFRPARPDVPLSSGEASMRVLGPVGTSFIWNRSHYHRATINASPTRRRVFKISIQHNYLQNDALVSEEFQKALQKIDPTDVFLHFLFGGKHASTHVGALLPEVSEAHVITRTFDANATIRTGAFWALFRKLKRKLWSAFF